MNPRYQRVAERLRSLIDESRTIASLERDHGYGARYIAEHDKLKAWLVNADNLVRTVFGSTSAHFEHLQRAMHGHVEHSYEVRAVEGILTGALRDLEGGFLDGHETLIAGVVFDSVLDQARHLVESGFKDPAAVLMRVVVEDALRRIARREGLGDSGTASRLNDALRDANCYRKPTWRLVQAWLDIGNAAAHGKFDEYKNGDVLRTIDDVSRFWAQEVER
jgi:hypothetical protein